MKTNGFDIDQPEKDKKLFRYMDKWKFNSIKESKFVFTNAINQEDPYDCYDNYKESGYTKIVNVERAFTLLSCWTLDNTYSEDKILKYCSFRDKADENDCDFAYVIEATYDKLLEFLKIKKGNSEVVTIQHIPYIIRYGIVKYVDTESIKGTICEGLHNSCFYKDKNNINRYQDENEFRIVAQCGATKEKPSNFICIQGNPKDFLTNVYKYNKSSGEFKQIGIPTVYGKTKKPSMYKSSKIN